MLGVTQGQNCFETEGIKLQEKEMPCEFRFIYFSTKIARKFQLKNQISI